jgi:hypothetical protein
MLVLEEAVEEETELQVGTQMTNFMLWSGIEAEILNSGKMIIFVLVSEHWQSRIWLMIHLIDQAPQHTLNVCWNWEV